MYEKFKELCEKNHKKQTEVLKELGISISNAANWRNRGGSVRSDVLLKLADYFNVTVDELLGRAGIDYSEGMSDNDIVISALRKDKVFYENINRLLFLPEEYRKSIYEQIDFQTMKWAREVNKKDAVSAG